MAKAAVVLSEKPEMFLIDPPLKPNIVPIAELLSECEQLNGEIDRVLPGDDRKGG